MALIKSSVTMRPRLTAREESIIDFSEMTWIAIERASPIIDAARLLQSVVR